MGNELRFCELIDHAADAFFLVTLDGEIVDVNQRACDGLGYSRDELRSMNLSDIDLDVERRDHKRRYWDKLRPGEPATFEGIQRRRDGSTFPVEVRCVLVESEEGPLMLGTVRDISERKRVEHALTEERHRAQQYLDVARVMFVGLDTRGRITLASRWTCEVLGYEERELLGEEWFSKCLPDGLGSQVRGVFGQLIAGDIVPVEYYENPVLTRDGKQRLIAWHNALLRDEDGRIIGTLSSGEDITERRDAEEALRRSEARIRSIFRAAPVGIGVVVNRILVDVNDRICEMLGYTPEELIGQSARMLYPSDEDYEYVGAEKYRQITERGTGTVETQWRKKDGTLLDVLLSSTPLDQNDWAAGVTFTALDITERKGAERALRESEERLRAVVEAMPVMLDAFDEQGNVVYWNAECERVTGFSRDEVVGRRDAMKRLYPDNDYRDWVLDTTKRNWGDFRNIEFELTCKDGTKRTVSWSSVADFVPIPGWATWAIGVDVTESKDAARERHRLEEQLQHSQKMEAIGTLAGGIAHDFNNILSAILGFAELALLDAEDRPELTENINEIALAGTRAKDLIGQILAFSRQTTHELKPLRMQSVVKEATKLLRASIPTTIEMRVAVAPDCGLVLGDATGVHQIVMNLCTNAYHAMRETGGILEVDLQEVEINERHAAEHLDLKAQRYAQLTICDTGHGIDELTLQRVFDPYFTTKEKGEGSGLGLAVVHTIVKAHDGAILVDSRPGHGSVFRVLVPVYEREVSAAPEAAGPTKPVEGSERVLFVDDEPPILEVSKRALTRLGYSVTTCSNGPEALAVFKEDPAGYDVVVTDLTMPRMTGVQLAERLLEIRPDIPIILCTGFSETMDPAKARSAGARGFLAKPVLARQMAETIRDVLHDD